MKIKYFSFTTMILISFFSTAQISEGNWMMGGSGSVGSFKATNEGNSSESTIFYLSPNVGYFFVDKFAVGVSGQIHYQLFSNEGEKTSNHSYAVSPFIRYYFLQKEKTINIFSEANFEMIKNGSSDRSADKFQIKAGPVFFLTNSVALEVALNYSIQKTNTDYQNRGIYIDVGFQIHL